MSKFEGTGTLTISGDDTRIYDCELVNGGLTVSGNDSRVERCRIEVKVTVSSNTLRVVVTDNVIDVLNDDCILLSGGNDDVRITGNWFNYSGS